jgi:hypothetical protein
VLLLFLCFPYADADGREPDGQLSVERLVEASRERLFLAKVPFPKSAPAVFDVRKAERYLNEHADYTSYHLLFFVRDVFPDVYARITDNTRARILCSTLEKSVLFNDWGDLDTDGDAFETAAGKELVAVGKDALPFLEHMLRDRRHAYLFGSEEATLSELWEWRVADYAYRYAMLILGRRPVFDRDPSVRLKRIECLRRELSATGR